MIKGSRKPKQEGLILSWRLQLGPQFVYLHLEYFIVRIPLLHFCWHHSTYRAPLQSCRFGDVRTFFQHDLVFEHRSVTTIFSWASYSLRSAVWNAKCACKPKKKSPKCGENSANELFQYNYPHLCTIWSLESMLHLFHLPEFSCLPRQESCFKSYWFSMTWCLINKPRVWISTVSISVTLILIHL